MDSPANDKTFQTCSTDFILGKNVNAAINDNLHIFYGHFPNIDVLDVSFK